MWNNYYIKHILDIFYFFFFNNSIFLLLIEFYGAMDIAICFKRYRVCKTQFFKSFNSI